MNNVIPFPSASSPSPEPVRAEEPEFLASSVRPETPFAVRDAFTMDTYSISGGSFNAPDDGVERALKFRAKCREMVAKALPAMPDSAQAASFDIERWASMYPKRVRAEVLVGWSDINSGKRFDFGASIWTDRSPNVAESELGIPKPIAAKIPAAAYDRRFAYLDFISSGAGWGQGYGAALLDRACSAARIVGYPAIAAQALTPKLAEWFSRKSFEVISPACDGRPAIMARRLGKLGE